VSDADISPDLRKRFARLSAMLAGVRSGGGGAGEAWFVPGRIELFGKHTDYAGGRSLLCATEQGFCVMAAPRADRLLTIVDARRQSSVILEAGRTAADVKWATYPLAVLRRLDRNFPGALRGADIILDSNLPSASGLSTSSALIVAMLLVLSRASGLEANEAWTDNIKSVEDLAAFAATIENGSSFRELAGASGVGTEGGSEDHTAILCSEANRLAQFAFCPTRRERTVKCAEDVVFAIGFSGVAARKTGEARGDYNRASQQVQYVLRRWNAETARTDRSLAAALASAPDAASRLRDLLRAEGDSIARVDQFVEESTVLVPAAADQFARSDWRGLGETAARSHELAERVLRNQVPETVTLVREARALGAYAASAFGAGFGGSVWALVDRSTAAAFLERWQNAYASAHAAAAARAAFFLTGAAGGASLVPQIGT
jgi:galactokinase